MHCSFLTPTGKTVIFGGKSYKPLIDFWGYKGMPIPDIHEVARFAKDIIIVKDDSAQIIATAIVHKTSIMGDRTKTLRNITIPEGLNGMVALRLIIELFSEKGRFGRKSYIYDEQSDVCKQNRMDIYREFGFTETCVLMQK